MATADDSFPDGARVGADLASDASRPREPTASSGFGSPGSDFTVKRIYLNDALIRQQPCRGAPARPCCGHWRCLRLCGTWRGGGARGAQDVCTPAVAPVSWHSHRVAGRRDAGVGVTAGALGFRWRHGECVCPASASAGSHGKAFGQAFRQRGDTGDRSYCPASTILSCVHRYLWEGRFGSMLIEARGDQVSFNGTLRESVDAAAWPNYRAA